MQKTRAITKDDNKQNWYLIDAKGVNLGKLSVRVSTLLMGKGKVTYAPNLFSGDNVIVINAKDISISEKKVDTKLYYRHSGYPGGLRKLSFSQLMDKNPSTVIREAVKGMLPKTKLADEMITHLYVYNDEKNPQSAQKPINLTTI